MKTKKSPEVVLIEREIEKEIKKVTKLVEQEVKVKDFAMASNYRAVLHTLERVLTIVNNIHKIKH